MSFVSYRVLLSHKPVQTMTRIMFAPFSGKVEFRDFWLADQFCSLVTPLVDLAFVLCFFLSDCWTEADPSVCIARLVVYRPIIAAVPYWWRMMQCVRRYYDYRFTRDLINMAKYGSSIGVILFAGLYNGLESGRWGPFKVLCPHFDFARVHVRISHIDT